MITVDHLHKLYGPAVALDDVTFSAEKGEILGFLGPNGAGKTTTMRILTGFLPATSGTARIAGFEVHANSMAVRKKIGYLPETPPLYPEMTVEGFLNFVAQIKGVPAGDRPQRITIALKRCGLDDRRKMLIRKLSKGYRQRVGIAQAIVHDPPVIVLDEPTVGLDPRQIIEVRNLIKNLAGDHTVILSTHILPEVSMTCDRITIINKGRIIATNTPGNLMTQLTGGSGYEVDVEGDISTITPMLKELPGVRNVETIAQPLPDNRHWFRIWTEADTELSGREVSGAIVRAGFGLYEMKRTQASLEDVFLQLTTEEATSQERSANDLMLEPSEPINSENEPVEPSSNESSPTELSEESSSSIAQEDP